MYAHLKWAYRLALTAAFVSVGGRVAAQTPEGTVITNTATATYTDANNNPYAAVSGSVTVTVGFLPGVAVTANTPSQTPASPSTSDSLTYTVQNTGNGTDSLSISATISNGAVMTVTGYRYASTLYATLADLNTALSGAAIAQNGSITLQVLYNVPVNQGGVNTIYTLTAASRRTPSTSDNKQSSITPSQVFCLGASCTGGGGPPNPPPPGGGGGQIYVGQPDSIVQVFKLPGNAYTITYVIQNSGNGTDSYDLFTSSPGSAVITRVTLDGVSGDSTRITVAAGASANVVVVYNVADVAAGSTDSLYLHVRSVGDPTLAHDGILALTVVKPALLVEKFAYRDDGTTLIGNNDRVIPGEYIRYRMTVHNTGSDNAVNVHVTDSLPAEVTYDSSSGDAGWGIVVNANIVSADWTGNLAAGAIGTFELRVRVN